MKKVKLKQNIKDLIMKGIKLFCVLVFTFSIVYYIKDNVKKRSEVSNVISVLFTNWNDQNMEKVYEISQKNSEFVFSTGFEKNEEISNIIDSHIFGGVEYELLDMKISGLGKKDAQAQATIHLKTYNNLEVLDVIIEQLLKDNSEITMNYNHKDFINQNIEGIKKAVEGVKKNSEKTVVIYLESSGTKWTIPYENNEEFYNSLSGNLISFNKEVEPEVKL